MARRVGFVVAHLVFAEHHAVGRLEVEERRAVGVELVALNAYAALGAAMEGRALTFEVGYFGVNGDDGVRKLVVAREGVDEAVAAHHEVAH